MPADLTLLHLQRNLAQTDDPERRKAIEARIAEREDLEEEVVEEEEAPSGLHDLTKADLLDLATDADIEGRSNMNKAELIAALEGN